jgi:hypothetical protein
MPRTLSSTTVVLSLALREEVLGEMLASTTNRIHGRPTTFRVGVHSGDWSGSRFQRS